ncbi:MAG: hypothetical protein AAF992_13870 [Bacteroidota bacterium]
MQKVLFLLIISVSISIIACEKDDESFLEEDEAQSYRLRVKNDTPLSFDNVFIKQVQSQHHYDPLQPNETSEYKVFTYVDSLGYPYIQVTIEGQDIEFNIQPIDDVSTTQTDHIKVRPLTCVIWANEYANNALDIYFVE